MEKIAKFPDPGGAHCRDVRVWTPVAKSRALGGGKPSDLELLLDGIRFMREELGIESEELPESYEDAKRVTVGVLGVLSLLIFGGLAVLDRWQ